MRRAARTLALVLAVLPAVASAAGVLLVSGSGEPARWIVAPVPYNPDRGRLGVLDNAAAIAFVASRFDVWQAVPSASIEFVNAGTLPVDVKANNYTAFLNQCDGRSPIIFDDDGSITDDLLGIGARNAILGFSSPECGDLAAGTITEALVVLNGRFIDGIDSANNPELSVEDYGAVFLHEFGHFFNLDHSQVGRAEAFDGIPTNDDVIPTMFPFLVSGAAAASLAIDDVASVSALYPTADFAATTGTIRGRILRADGRPFQGAYVIARSVTDPRRTAVGGASGARFMPAIDGGPPPPELEGAYELPGLPPGTYTVEVEAIDPRFTGGSSVGPLDPPVALPGVPEYWNGDDEAATNPPDDPDSAQAITVGPGTVPESIDIRLNEPVALNDDCADAIVVPRVPFVDTQAAIAATTAAGDPQQSCTLPDAPLNGASVWYVFVAPSSGRYVIETAKSDYDTVLSAFTGTCGALDDVACSDDTATTVQSRLDLDLAAGARLVVEVTSYKDTVPRTLRIGFHFGCASDSGPCDDGDPCTSADVCADGICAGPIGTCDDANACTADTCTPIGACIHQAVPASCDDGDVCSISDACAAAACVGGTRIDAETLAATLDSALPIACGPERQRVRRALLHRFARASTQVTRAAQGATQNAGKRQRAFRHARALLRGIDRTARRLGRRGNVQCGAALTARSSAAQAQLECIAADLGG
jgi:hypothetical protein